MLGWLVFGLIVGALAKFLMPGKDPGGCIITALLGVAGSLLGGLLGKAVGGSGDPAGWIGSVIGTILLLILYRYRVKALDGNRRRTSALRPPLKTRSAFCFKLRNLEFTSPSLPASARGRP